MDKSTDYELPKTSRELSKTVVTVSSNCSNNFRKQWALSFFLETPPHYSSDNLNARKQILKFLHFGFAYQHPLFRNVATQIERQTIVKP